MDQEPPFGGLHGNAACASETLRTVTLGTTVKLGLAADRSACCEPPIYAFEARSGL
jgi:hypothetical protein